MLSPPLYPPAMSRSSSSSTIALMPSTPPCPRYDSIAIAVPPYDCGLAHGLAGLAPLSPVSKSHSCLDLPAAKVTKPIKALLSPAIAQLDRPLRLVGLLATPDSGCHMYADMTARACAAAEVVFDKVDISAVHSSPTAFEQVRAVIQQLNADTSLDGLIVYFPLFSPERDAALRALIAPRIDVEGVSPASLERSYARAPQTVEETTADPGSGTVYPCTALAVFRALQVPEAGLYDPAAAVDARFRGKTVTIINRSETVGRPLAGMLANAGARVYSVDIDSVQLFEQSGAYHTVTPVSRPLSSLLAESDAVVSAVPGHYTVPTAHLRPGAVCVDLSEHGNFAPDVRARAGVFAPRLGSVTVLMLKMNALVLRARR